MTAFEQIKENDLNYILHTYGRVDIALVKGRNARVWDDAGKEYIDFTSGIGVNSLGYCDPQWVEAVAKQAGEIQHLSNYYHSPRNIELAEDLARAGGMARAFFCNSGAEANECAVKVARKAGGKESGHKFKIITLINSFHGRTLTTLAATGQEVFHKKFLPLTEGFAYAWAGDLAGLEELIDDETCGVMLECVQGEGGVIPMEDGYLKGVRELCDKKGISMIVDEVQTGIGRTGTFFAYQSAGIVPDIVTCAKGLGGGLPIGVCMVSDKLKEVFEPGDNGSTFGGNPVVCAGAREVVRRVSAPDFLDEVIKKGEYIREKLEKLPQVEFIRGKGLMLGIKLKPGCAGAHDIMLQCAEKGLLILTAKDLVRFLPPLTITISDIDEGLSIFEAVI